MTQPAGRETGIIFFQIAGSSLFHDNAGKKAPPPKKPKLNKCLTSSMGNAEKIDKVNLGHGIWRDCVIGYHNCSAAQPENLWGGWKDMRASRKVACHPGPKRKDTSMQVIFRSKNCNPVPLQSPEIPKVHFKVRNGPFFLDPPEKWPQKSIKMSQKSVLGN